MTLEIDSEHLWNIFGLLAAQGQAEVLRRYLIQLYNEEFLREADAVTIAEYYRIPAPEFH